MRKSVITGLFIMNMSNRYQINGSKGQTSVKW